MYLNKICQRRSFDVVKFRRQNKTRSGDALSVGLVDDDLEDELLEVDVGHGQRQEVQTTFGDRDSSHLSLDAKKLLETIFFLQISILNFKGIISD